MLLGLGLSISHAGKGGFSTQMFCDDGYGPQYAGCAQLTKKGDFKAKLTGLPSNTPMSCILECEQMGFPMDLAECGVTDKDGNLEINYKEIAEGFGGPCVGLQVTVYSPGEISCTQGFGKIGGCKADPPIKMGNLERVRCFSDPKNPCQSPNSCIAYKVKNGTNQRDGTNDTNYIDYDPATHHAECYCQ